MNIDKYNFPLTTKLAEELNVCTNEAVLNSCSEDSNLKTLSDVFYFEKSVLGVKHGLEVTVVDNIKYLMKIVHLSSHAMDYCFGVSKSEPILLYLNIHNKACCKLISKNLEYVITTNIDENTHIMLSSLMVKIKLD